MSFLLVPLTLASLCAAQTTFQPYGQPFKAPVVTASTLTASVLFTNLTAPRGVAVDALDNILVIERGFGVTAFSPAPNGTGTLRNVVLSNSGVTHGIEVSDDTLYISTATQALAFAYDASTQTVSGSGNVIVDGFPTGGELTTHTLLLSSDKSSIFIGSGPGENIDPDARNASSGWSQIRSFSLSPSPSTPISWLEGELIAYGIRNPAGFAYPLGNTHQLYVVENGASIDSVTGLTPAFVNDNPADELELVNLDTQAEWFGFPDCTSIWNPDADPIGVPQYTDYVRGQQFSLGLLPERDDAWCQVVSNNQPPKTVFQAHSVPLDIKFYEAPSVLKEGSLPQSCVGDAFVTFHGSFNRDPPTGYSVVRLPTPDVDGSTYETVVEAQDLTGCPSSCQSIRPAGLVFSSGGELYVTSDSSGELFVVQGI